MKKKKLKSVTDVRLGPYIKYENSVGDTWDPTWAADENLYSPGNDGSGWDKACSSNVFFNRVIGDDYATLKGETISGMTEYGRWKESGENECTWKSAGCISVDGVLYLFVHRQRLETFRASIIKSMDFGKTWVRPALENYEHAMFPEQRFGSPYFIHYGKDGKPPAIDNADRYIYAISNNGFWCNGDNYILGRVERDKLGRLNPLDWEYYVQGDGMDMSAWSKDMFKASLIIDNPRKCGQTGATYIPALGRYVLIAWHYPGNPLIDTDKTVFIFYEAPAPWGPWTLVKEETIWPEGWYCPRLLSKWQDEDEQDARGVIATGGDYWKRDYYRFALVPVSFKTGGKYPAPDPAPKTRVYNDNIIGDGLHQFQYQGNWQYERFRRAAFEKDEHYSDNAGDSFTFAFEGTRIRWYGSQFGTLGFAAVSVDDGPKIELDLHSWAYSTPYQRLLYDSGPLPKGTHTFKVIVLGSGPTKGCRTYNDKVEVFD